MGLIKQCYLGYICWATRSISFEPWLGQSEERKRKKQSLTLSSSSASSSPHSGSSLNMLLNLLGWHWLIKLHWFQVYNSIVRYLYTILSVYSIPCVRHPESSLVSLPCIPLYPFLSASLTSFPSGNHQPPYCCLCVSLRGFGVFFCLIPLQFPPSSLTLPHFWQLSVLFLYLWVCFYFVC